MATKKKPGALSRLRLEVRGLKQLAETRLHTIERLTADRQELETRLNEARRRTIALGDGSEINFLPLGIRELNVRHDIKRFRSMNGSLEAFASGPAEAIIVADGATLIYTAPPAKK